MSNEPSYHIPAGQPDQIFFVLVEGDVMLGIDNFEGGVVGAEEESDSGCVVGIRNGVIQDIVDDPLLGES